MMMMMINNNILLYVKCILNVLLFLVNTCVDISFLLKGRFGCRLSGITITDIQTHSFDFTLQKLLLYTKNKFTCYNRFAQLYNLQLFTDESTVASRITVLKLHEIYK